MQRLIIMFAICATANSWACSEWGDRFINMVNALPDSFSYADAHSSEPSNLGDSSFSRDYEQWYPTVTQALLKDRYNILRTRAVWYQVIARRDEIEACGGDYVSRIEEHAARLKSLHEQAQLAWKHTEQTEALVEQGILPMGLRAMTTLGYYDGPIESPSTGRIVSALRFFNIRTGENSRQNPQGFGYSMALAHQHATPIRPCLINGCSITPQLIDILKMHWPKLSEKYPALINTLGRQACTRVDTLFAEAQSEAELDKKQVAQLSKLCAQQAPKSLFSDHEKSFTAVAKQQYLAFQRRVNPNKKEADEPPAWPPTGPLVLQLENLELTLTFTNINGLYDVQNSQLQVSGRLKDKLNLAGEYLGKTVFVTITPDNKVVLRYENGGRQDGLLVRPQQSKDASS